MIGLALYNGVILDIHFPSVVFKKMMGLKPELADVKSFNPVRVTASNMWMCVRPGALAHALAGSV